MEKNLNGVEGFMVTRNGWGYYEWRLMAGEKKKKNSKNFHFFFLSFNSSYCWLTPPLIFFFFLSFVCLLSFPTSSTYVFSNLFFCLFQLLFNFFKNFVFNFFNFLFNFSYSSTSCSTCSTSSSTSSFFPLNLSENLLFPSSLETSFFPFSFQFQKTFYAPAPVLSRTFHLILAYRQNSFLFFPQ